MRLLGCRKHSGRFCQLLLAIVVLVFAESAEARSAHQLGPLVGFELFERNRPEELGIVRIGAGLALLSDINPSLAAQFGLGYTSEDTTFQSENTLEERSYSVRAGLFLKIWERSAIRVGWITGAQYSLVTQTYVTKQPAASYPFRGFFWSPYVSLEGQLIPLSGFGIRQGLSAFYDYLEKNWVPQYYFGLFF